MAMQTQPSRIPEPFAGSGTRNAIPAENGSPTASQAASWASGFPPECSRPISAGGCPVPRNDVNGALNQISQDYAFRQDGGIWAWSAQADYDAQRLVRGADGRLYWSVQQSGPGFASGAVDPAGDDGSYWTAPAVKTMPLDDASASAASTQWVSGWYESKFAQTTFYVDGSAGSDANDGTAERPVKTIGRAIELSRVNRKVGGRQTISVAAGNYQTEDFFLDGSRGDQIDLEATGGTVAIRRLYVQHGAFCQVFGAWEISRSDGVPISLLTAISQAVVSFADGASVTFSGSIGSGPAMEAKTNALIMFRNSAGVSFVFSGLTCGTSLSVEAGATFYSANTSGLTWSGTASGSRYRARYNACIAGVGGADVIPGSSAGSADSSSYYG